LERRLEVRAGVAAMIAVVAEASLDDSTDVIASILPIRFSSHAVELSIRIDFPFPRDDPFVLKGADAPSFFLVVLMMLFGKLSRR
jgi:hypothetical protein